MKSSREEVGRGFDYQRQKKEAEKLRQPVRVRHEHGAI